MPSKNKTSKHSKTYHQLLFSDAFRPQEKAFGATLLKGSNPKTMRPLDSKLPVHLVLRSSRAVGEHSMRRGNRRKEIEQIVFKTANKHGVRIYEYANAGNHLHILLRLHKRFLWKAFICELTGRIANKMMGFGPRKGAKFWDYRPFTRVIAGWKRAYRLAKDYVALNTLEAMGVATRRDAHWREFIYPSWSTS